MTTGMVLAPVQPGPSMGPLEFAPHDARVEARIGLAGDLGTHQTIAGAKDLPRVDFTPSPDQRHHQYQSGHNSTENGVPLHIDSDCAGGPVFGQGASYGDSETSEGGASEDPYSCVTVGA